MFRLAFLLNKTVSELVSEISYEEFIYWQAYLSKEPPDEADNNRLAVLMAQITNMSGKSLPKNKTVSPEDFLKQKKPQSLEDQIAFMKGLGNG